MNMRRIRVIVAKLGLDGHDRGAKVISRFLRDAGMEVIYTGIRQTPEEVSTIALQEDVDLIGVSILSGAHKTLVPKLLERLNLDELNVPVIVGGIVPDEDIEFLESVGVKAVFTPGASAKQIIQTIEEIVRDARD